MKNYSLNHIVKFMAGYQAVQACQSAEGEIDFGRMFLEYPEQVMDFVSLASGEDAKSKPLHEVIEQMTENLPAEMTAMADYFDTQLGPALQKLTDLIKPKG